MSTPKNFDSTLLSLDAQAQAELLAQNKITCEVLTQQIFAAIAQLNPTLNCFVSLAQDQALAQARASDIRRKQGTCLSVFDGLSFAVKDNIDVAGEITREGLNLPDDAVAALTHAFVVKKLLAAGCVYLGRLNMHEIALGATNDNPNAGRCFNPHKNNYTPGGSSGGSGCAVAAGLCSFALGTDTMGSVRLPASYCGVVGLKPSVGAISVRGVAVLSRKLDHVGLLARSSRDIKTLLSLTQSYDSSCPQSRPYPVKEALLSNLKGVQLSVLNEFPAGQVQADVLRCYQSSLAAMESSGCVLQRVSCQKIDFSRYRRAGLLACELDAYVAHEALLERYPQALSTPVMDLLQWGMKQSANKIAKAYATLDSAAELLDALMGDNRWLISPTTPQVAFDFSDAVPTGQADFTSLANMAGWPAINIPCAKTAEGLPIGLQIIGRLGDDQGVLALAEKFIQTFEWYSPAPALLENAAL